MTDEPHGRVALTLNGELKRASAKLEIQFDDGDVTGAGY